MMKLIDKHIVVIGAARSGTAAAKLLKNKGADVFVTDSEEIAENFKTQLINNDIRFEENGHSKKAENGEFAVISPGVPTQSRLVQAYLQSGKKVISEIELAGRFHKGRIVAVTGSNGKTTVTHWLDHIWKLAEKNHLTAGNVGNAFSDSVEEAGKGEDAILEVSSFQLDHIETFHPHISIILNITPDHLNRYEQKLEKYAESKFNIVKNQHADDWLIYHYDDPIIQEHIDQLKKKVQRPACCLFHQKRSCRRGLSPATKILSLN